MLSLNIVDNLTLAGAADVLVVGAEQLNMQSTTLAMSFVIDNIDGTHGLVSRDALYTLGNGQHMTVYVRNGKLVARLQDGDDELRLVFDGIEEGQEFHFALSFGEGTAQLYVDGEKVDSGATDLTWADNPEQLQIGATGWRSQSGEDDFGNVLDGRVADVKIFDTILSDAEVADLRNGVSPEIEDDNTAPETPQTSDTPPMLAEGDLIYANAGMALRDDSDVVIVDAADLDMARTTVALSFNMETTDGTHGLVSRDAIRDTGNGEHLSVYVRNGKLIARLQNDDGELRMVYNGVEEGKDYDFALTFGNGTAQLFVDGEMVQDGRSSLTWKDSPEQLQIGALGWRSKTGEDTFDDVFDGEISNVQIFSTILSADEVAALSDTTTASGSTTPAPVTPEPEPEPEPVAFTPLTADPVAEPEEEAPLEPVAEPAIEPAAEPVTASEPEPEPEAPISSADRVAADDADAIENEVQTEPYDVDHGTVTALTNSTSVITGRVTTLDIGEDNVASIDILDKPAYGNLTVNPDNTLALVLTHETKTQDISFSYEVTYEDGSSQTFTKSVDVKPVTQAEGWGEGSFYQLETDEDGDVIVEHGEDHRKVFISNSDDALSAADIAAIEGLPRSAIDAEWLAGHPEYGGSENMALRPGIGMDLWREVTGNDDANSNWLLFERGYEYSDAEVGDLIQRDTHGTSELHPTYVGAWGEGARPVIHADLDIFKGDNSNIVFQGVEFTEKSLLIEAENILFDDITFSNTIAVQESDSITIRNSALYEVYNEDPVGGDWTDEHGNRIQGIFVRGTEHVLLEDLFVDQVGWQEGYSENLNIDNGQPASIYSQNIYVNYDNLDVTLRDTISSRSAAYGAQVRSGGFVEDNVFLDNNSALNTLGGDYKNAGTVGNYSLIEGNLITSAGYRDSDGNVGALSQGINNRGDLTSLVDNVVTHLADPDSDELDYKYWVHSPLNNDRDTYYDDTIVYNWFGARLFEARVNANVDDRGIEGLNENELDETTIQNYTEELLNQDEAAISDLANYLRAIHEGEIEGNVTADDIIAFFADPFGLEQDTRTENTTLRFVPDDRGEGTRWDNELNWDTEDTPMDGDSVDLAGNWVQFDGTIRLDDLDFGDDGRLDVTHGRLEVADDVLGSGTLNISGAGQVWAEDYTGEDGLEINVDGGRFANTGKFDGLFDILANDGQTLLGVDDAELTVGDGSTLNINGSDAQVGFDGQEGGVSVLDLDGGTLSITADDNGISTIEEFRSGALGNEPNVLSGFDMGEGTLLLDVTDLKTGAEEVLVEVDEMVGMFNDVQVVGLSGNQNAQLFFDYEADTVTLKLVGGNGGVDIFAEGDSNDADQSTELWDALTDGQGTYEELGDSLTVNGEELDEDDILAA